MTWRVGVDSGGTFTDVCLFDDQSGRVEVWKVPSTPDDPGAPPAAPVLHVGVMAYEFMEGAMKDEPPPPGVPL